MGGGEVGERMNETTQGEIKKERNEIECLHWREAERMEREGRGEIKGNTECQGKKKALTG